MEKAEYVKIIKAYLDKLDYTLIDESVYGTYLHVLSKQGKEEFIAKPKLSELLKEKI